MAQVIKTGNIVTPPAPKVTERKSTAVRIGRGDAPDEGLARPASMASGRPILGHMVKVKRDSLATVLGGRPYSREKRSVRCRGL